ncbi:GTP-binding protein [Lactobacillus sp. PV034]|uniref:GTP-binding protein n=1 Tax=Lactobacillus sp. PV034 TaxID=2594495 RepID=UPI00223F18BB|nr:TetM/TetW/TetO/TetS family tetracycline resistance ribosomal protection protein [Lactobacillus sp. PV034]QNQ80868.1 TetM/TetW/TetO/TetS family tetracycline resistance ribosomal protection protein [Lactobacillus sp. PV034]
MKQINIGILAHVDAGKTTLSEAMLYKAGSLRKLGRVDNGDAFLDTDVLEKKRGITIFSHVAQMDWQDTHFTLVDTPGHIDFVNQLQSSLSVLDYAILVISAADGVTAYTKTIWHLLDKLQIPTFIFVNKIDQVDNQAKIFSNLQKDLSDALVDFTAPKAEIDENMATVDEHLLEEFLENGVISLGEIKKLIKKRKIFPTYFGSALKLNGVTEFLTGLDQYTLAPNFTDEFGARVFKISSSQNERLTWVKVTGGILKAKQSLGDEKADELRQYNGEKFKTVSELQAGQISVIKGLTSSFVGQGLGAEQDLSTAYLQPVLNYSVETAEDLHQVLVALQELEQEDPLLKVEWSKDLDEISVQLMGQMQAEILEQLLQERFNLNVKLVQGNVLYQETITQEVEAVGHFEPLRHYAEVHFLLKPLPAGSGIQVKSECSLEILPSNWQHQILHALREKTHLGVLGGFPLTDVEIVLIGGKGSEVHTVGGDFRQASWRGVRQGLMELKAKGAVKLLEPWYDFRLTIPSDQLGRAINDIQKMGGNFKIEGEDTLVGQAPVAQMKNYQQEVRSYSHGEGSLECVVSGYQDCQNSSEIIQSQNYDPLSDIDNTPNSVFCYHGAGHTITWDQVPEHAQYPYLK